MATYKPMQSVSVTAPTSSIIFSGIDQNYTDLIIIGSIKVTAGTPVVQLVINSDTNSNYSRTGMYGDGATPSGYKNTSASSLELFSADTTNFTPITLHLANYSNITTNKAVLQRSGKTYPTIAAGLWRSTSAINALTMRLSASTFEPGSTFSLYGIKSGAPQALGGDRITTDGSYWYHTFLNTGTFTPLKPLSAQTLVVAGGGGGGGNGVYYLGTGGGGAGGLLYSASQSISAIAQTVTVGAGGPVSTNGNNSQIGSLTAAVGGGKGADGNSGVGGNGGSGGGSSGVLTQSSGTSGQGNNGGNGPAIGFNGSGGGGGAGAAGGVTTGTTGAAGGIGLNTYSSWLTTVGVGGDSGYLAGGGGGGGYSYNSTSGGSGGSGGGGTASGSGGGAAMALTGGGGGGSWTTGGAGGSGIVIVRYPV